MIELNKKTQQDFLNREWVQRLLDAGVDMNDAKYYIATYRDSEKMFEAIWYKDELDFEVIKTYEREHPDCKVDRMPTYTVSELLYKLHINNNFRPDCLSVDILSCTSFLCSVDMDNNHEVLLTNGPGCRDSYIQSLASLLIQCHKKGEGDTGNISDK